MKLSRLLALFAALPLLAFGAVSGPLARGRRRPPRPSCRIPAARQHEGRRRHRAPARPDRRAEPGETHPAHPG